MLNICFTEDRILKIWQQSRIIDILKPGKDSSIPKSYIPISLLCNAYTLYEWLILNKIAPSVEWHLIEEQASFQPRESYTSQLLNLTQHIEDGYQRGMITGAAFIDLSAAYDTVNHIILIQKLYNTTHDSQLCRVIQNLLSSRRFYVELNNQRSRWRNQKNGLHQVVSCHLYCSISTQTISQSIEERETVFTQTTRCNSPVLILHRGRTNDRGGTWGTYTLL